MSRPPVILDFDCSVGALPGARSLPLHGWQERIRFGCRWRQYRRLAEHLTPQLPRQRGCVFTGSGDYHHLTLLLLQRLPLNEKIRLIVCDNHPDNMRYPFGLHCGSWVYWASRLPQVAHIDVVGITSTDISDKHAWENHWTPLRHDRLTYWSIGTDNCWLRRIGATHGLRVFDCADRLLAALLNSLDTAMPVYLSIDKDVLNPDTVRTNWDQGQFQEWHLNTLISACSDRLIGADITGDVSAYTYQSRFKRWLSAADGQSLPPAAELTVWQAQHRHLNRRLLERLRQSWA